MFVMEISEVIQLMRTTNLAQVKQQLEYAKQHQPDEYAEVCNFFTQANKNKADTPD